jgi:hypothetical protein
VTTTAPSPNQPKTCRWPPDIWTPTSVARYLVLRFTNSCRVRWPMVWCGLDRPRRAGPHPVRMTTAGPAPRFQPTVTDAQVATCQQLIRRHSAPQAEVYRAKLVLLLDEDPGVNDVAAGRQLGKHENWVRYWRRIWASAGFRLTDKPGRGAQQRVSPPAAGDGGGAGLRTARAPQGAPESLQHRRIGAPDQRRSQRPTAQSQHDLAHPRPACAQTLALPQLALPPRPELRRQSGARARPVCRHLDGRTRGPGRLRAERR